MPIYIYASLNEYLYGSQYSVIPLRIYGNCPFRIDIINQELLITYDGEQVEEKYYSYELLTDKLLIFKGRYQREIEKCQSQKKN